MAIVAGNDILASDFVSSSAGAGDAGKVPKLNAFGKIDPTFLGTVKFGGNGADGALSISSGTTTIDLGGAKTYIKNYTTISITGTGTLAFINPHSTGTAILLKTTGNITLSSSQTPMIDISNCGGAGGTAGSVGASSQANGNAGNNGVFGFLSVGGGSAGAVNAGATGGTSGVFAYDVTALTSAAVLKYRATLAPGGGGGGGAVKTGSGSAATGGRGGNGAGLLIIECAGTFNFTTTNGLSLKGENGQGYQVASGGNREAAGGGGGGNGTILVLYETAGTITGTIDTTNSSGGSGASGSITNPRPNSGGGGGGLTSAGGGNSYQTLSGPAGGNGFSLITQNTEFA